MAIMEVVLAGSYAGQQIINRWNYIAGGTPASVSLSFALTSAFGAIYDLIAVPPGYPSGTVLDTMMGNLSSAYTLTQITALDVYSVTDFYQTPFVQPYAGSQGGESLSPTQAYGFRTNVVRRDVARGTKRLVGVVEPASTGLGVLTSTYQTAMNAIATKFSEVLEYDDEGNTLTFTPAVCGKELYDPNPTNPSGNHRAYRYFPDEAEQLDHTAVGVLWQAYTTIRTQVSRQYGKGS